MNKIHSIYLHIPFCHSICSYCDFNKRVSKSLNQQKYVDKLIEEIKYYKENYHINNDDIYTIYLGGGTPSSLNLKMLSTLLQAIEINFVGINLSEFTIEANLEDLNLDFIDLIKKYHINRISIGVETFNQNILSLMNRKMDYAKLKNKIDLLKNKGINNINLDLMYGFSEDKTILTKDLELITSLNPTHISIYSLILEENTVLYHKYLNGEFKPINESIESEFYYYIIDYLAKLGYNHYEISNFAKENYESIHNRVYWLSEEYYAIGLGASGYINNIRYQNIPDLKLYLNSNLENISKYNIEEITNIDKIKYQIMLNLRLIEGIDLDRFNTIYKIDLLTIDKIQDLIKEEVLKVQDHHLKFNQKYLYTQDYYIRILFETIDNLFVGENHGY